MLQVCYINNKLLESNIPAYDIRQFESNLETTKMQQSVILMEGFAIARCNNFFKRLQENKEHKEINYECTNHELLRIIKARRFERKTKVRV